MKTATLASITLAALLVTPAAFADTPSQPLVEIENDDVMVTSLGKSVDDVEDLSVVDPTGATIGEVDEVLGTADGTPTAISVDAGGFLGVGSKEVIVSLDQVTLSSDGNLVLNMTKEQVEALPAWQD